MELNPKKKPEPVYDDEYFKSNYNTKLSPADEFAYRKWVAEHSKKLGRDVSMDEYDYDMRGYWLSLPSGKSVDGGHAPDTYKKPNHPTFSIESVYHGTKAPWGGVFEGGVWGDKTYKPSKSMLQRTHNIERLKAYFKEREPGVLLEVDDESK